MSSSESLPFEPSPFSQAIQTIVWNGLINPGTIQIFLDDPEAYLRREEYQRLQLEPYQIQGLREAAAIVRDKPQSEDPVKQLAAVLSEMANLPWLTPEQAAWARSEADQFPL